MTKVGNITLYDTNDVMKMLKIGKEKTLKVFKMKELKAIQAGNKYWVSEDNLRNFLNSGKKF